MSKTYREKKILKNNIRKDFDVFHVEILRTFTQNKPRLTLTKSFYIFKRVQRIKTNSSVNYYA